MERTQRKGRTTVYEVSSVGQGRRGEKENIKTIINTEKAKRSSRPKRLRKSHQRKKK